MIGGERKSTEVKAGGSDRGASIIEIMLAIAVFGALAASLLIFVWEPMSSSGSASERQRAMFLAEEGLEAARSIRAGGWTALAEGAHGIAKPGGIWQFSGASDETDGFTRVISVEAVERDPSGNIVAEGGVADPRTKLITSTVSWPSIFGGTKSLDLHAYLTNWNVYDWTQTTDADFGAGSHYQTRVQETGAAAYVELEPAMAKAWTPAGGILVTHTTDTDWSPGAFTDTAVNGSGIPATVSGVGSPEWIQMISGKSLYEATDIDFNDGIFTDTVTADTGDPAYVTLAFRTQWSGLTAPTSWELFGLSMLTDSDGWAVGDKGDIARWNGSSWNLVTSPVGSSIILYSADAVASDDAWAVGSRGYILRWNGASWAVHTDTGNHVWRGVRMLSASDGWVVAQGGGIRRWNGTSWNIVTSPTTNNLYGLDFISASNGFAVGAGGRIIRWNGTNWSTVTSPTTDALYGVAFSSASNGFAVGAGGRIIRWNGTNWSTVASPTGNQLNGVSAVSDSEFWAVGANGTLLRWNGSVWSVETAPSSSNMNGIDMLSGSSGHACGAGGSVWRYGSAFVPSGIYVSSVLDAGAIADWGHAFWAEYLPAGTDLTAAFRGGNTPVPDGSWSAWSAEFSDPYNTPIPITDSRYIQYRVTMTTSDNSAAPEFDAISVTYDEPAAETHYDVTVLPANDDGWMVGTGGALARFDGSAWSEYPSSFSANLLGVDHYDASHVWTVGADGFVGFWNGSVWSAQASGTTAELASVSAVGAASAYAVGAGGTIIRWNGTAWSAMSSGTTRNLMGVDMLSDSYGWAVGRTGTIIGWNGSSWSAAASGTTQLLNAVSAASSGFAVAVGQTGTILHWNGSAWSAAASGTTNHLYAVHCLAADDCWVTGAQQTFLHWDGLVWSRYVFSNPSNPIVRGVYMVGPHDGWAVGESGAVYHYVDFVPSPAYYLSPVIDSGTVAAVWNWIGWDSISQLFSDLTAAVRTGPTATPDGSWSAWSAELTDTGGSAITSPANRYLQYRYTFTNTRPERTAVLEEVRVMHGQPTGQALYGVEGSAVNDVWAVGRVGTIMHYDGSAWAPMASPTTRQLNDVDTVSSVLAFAVGNNGTLIGWDGSLWNTLSSPTSNDLNAVSMVDASFGAAVGDGGTILHWDGASWSSQSSPTSNDLYGVFILTVSEGFAVGASGTILRWDGVAWSAASSPTVQDLNDVHALSSSHGWAAGDGGTILSYDGVNWSVAASPVVNDLHGIESRSTSEAWAVGDFGAILEYDGISWSSFTSPTTRHLYDLTVENPTDGWAVGFLGTILKDPIPYYTNGAFTSMVLDADVVSGFGAAFWNAVLGAGHTITVATRSGGTATPDGSWSPWSAEIPLGTGMAIASPDARYLQYRASLNTTDQWTSPRFEDITLTFTQ